MFQQNFGKMCQYESVKFNCGHKTLRLIKHCHFARNDPMHNCFGAWSVSSEHDLPDENCRYCVAAGAPRHIDGDAGGTGVSTVGGEFKQ
jgi:hypothetical protein